MSKKLIKLSLYVSLCLIMLLISCGKVITKYEAFPKMYEEKPITILVLPPINESTAAESKGYYITTIAEPLTQKGYYVYPTEVILDILRSEGLYDTEILTDSSVSKFKDYFYADAVLFLTIKEWDTSYYVVGGNVTVNLMYKLVSTTSLETLWKYEGELTVNTTGDSGGQGGLAGLLIAVVSTAVETATTEYIPVAKKINEESLISIPYGKYHKSFNKDGNQKVVKEKLAKTE